MPPQTGIFLISELKGVAARRIGTIQQRYDPKLAANTPPHVTIIGSSGAGPISPATSPDELREALEEIARTTPPMTLHFASPVRFMQTDIVALPLSPHGELRALHERIRRCGLGFRKPRFVFTPHCTLSFYPQLTPAKARELLAIRVSEPAVIDSLQAYLSNDPLPSRKLLQLPLGG